MRRPAALTALVAAVGVEVLALVAVVVLYLVELVRVGAADALGAVATAVLAAAVAVGLALCARALLAGRRWARAPVLTWQLLQLLVVGPLLTGPLWWVAAPLVLVAVVTAVALFVPAVVRATTGEQPPPAT